MSAYGLSSVKSPDATKATPPPDIAQNTTEPLTPTAPPSCLSHARNRIVLRLSRGLQNATSTIEPTTLTYAREKSRSSVKSATAIEPTLPTAIARPIIEMNTPTAQPSWLTHARNRNVLRLSRGKMHAPPTMIPTTLNECRNSEPSCSTHARTPCVQLLFHRRPIA
jgi:hypothetical protein